jgi:hypothetical protein
LVSSSGDNWVSRFEFDFTNAPSAVRTALKNSGRLSLRERNKVIGFMMEEILEVRLSVIINVLFNNLLQACPHPKGSHLNILASRFCSIYPNAFRDDFSSGVTTVTEKLVYKRDNSGRNSSLSSARKEKQKGSPS